ncbi:MAG TPA: VCBS repeat-containing protein [Planctomycetota bacterium]|nr:VCBS repeat-containing protein [Planctomycetota bacterium]
MTRRILSASIALAACIAVAAPASAQATGIFPGELIHMGGEGGIRVLRLADLNGDSILDLVAGSPIDGLLVRLGLGSADYGELGWYPMPGVDQDMELADLDGDGHLDFVAAGKIFLTPSLTVLLGDGAGAFAATPIVSALASPPLDPMTLQPRHLEVGDFTGDGVLDALVVQTQPSAILVAPGDGAGGFAAPIVTPDPKIELEIRVGDLDLDGNLDAAMVEIGATTNVVVAHLGDGAGHFAAQPPIDGVSPPQELVLGDTNADGVLDAIVLETIDDQIEVFHGNGAGGFGHPVLSTYVLPGPIDGVAFVEGADLDADGRLDLVMTSITANGSPSTGHTLLGQPGSHFGSQSSVPLAAISVELAIGDADGDSIPDVAFEAEEFLFPYVEIRRGDGAGGLSSVPLVATAVPPTQVLVGELDGDGKLDLVATSKAAGAATTVLRGGGDGTFAPASQLAESGESALGDLTSDGVLDLVTCDAAGALEVRAGDGAAAFGPKTSFPTTGTAAVALGDVDGDGDLDAVSTRDAADQGGLFVLLGDGAGALSPQTTALAEPGGRIVLRDVNADGVLDAATAHAKLFAVSLGSGAGGFVTSLSLPGGGGAPSFVRHEIADLNGDGRPDFAVLTTAGIEFHLGDGAGGSSSSSFLPIAETPVAFAVADVTGDGRADVVTAQDYVRVRQGDGSGDAAALGFPAAIYSTCNTARALAVADLDGNGRVDLVVGHAVASSVSVLLNDAHAPAGTSLAGIGTPGCAGTHGLAATSAPAIGNASFAIATTQAPPSAVGLCLVADVANAAGSDPFGLGLVVHLDVFASTTLLPLPASSDGSGYALSPAAIPNAPGLAGATVHAQSIWVWSGAGACTPSPFGLSSSKVLSVTLGN